MFHGNFYIPSCEMVSVVSSSQKNILKKNALSALLSYISTREFLRTREKCVEARAFRRVLLALLDHEGTRFVTEQKWARILIDQHQFSLNTYASLRSIGSKFGWQPMTGVEKNKQESIEIISKSEIHSWKNFFKFKQLTFLRLEADSNLSVPNVLYRS